jgi:hypothetical protein
MTFLKELEHLINKHNVDNDTNTPDFVLASFVITCIAALEAVRSATPKEGAINVEALLKLGRQYMTGTVSSGEFATRIMVILGFADPKDTRCSAGQLVSEDEYAPSKLIDPRGRPLSPVTSGPLHYDTAHISQEITINVLNHGDPRQIWDKIVESIVRDICDRRGLDHAWLAIDEDIKSEIRTSWENIIREHLAKWVEESAR